ncbi:MAG: hypothetical protein ABL888_03250 [Pirellulaceae bacterium]
MKPFIESEKLVMLGVIQEQHPDRCQLFMQWKKLDFPIVQDLLNTNGIDVVPLYVAIDEHGVVQANPRSSGNFAEEFINVNYLPPQETAPVLDARTASVEYWTDSDSQPPSMSRLLGLADASIQWQPNQEQVAKAIKAYTEILESDASRSDIVFRLGAANRLLYELSAQRDKNLFTKAVDHWEKALQMNPNQYIYRRRIEQYGPRLKKPYAFYDWVTTARQEILARGVDPHPLAVEPNGAEFADRAQNMTIDNSGKNPALEYRILLGADNLVEVHTNFVPTQPKPGDVVAVHVGFSISGTAKWNHETSPLVLWIYKPKNDIKLSSQLISDPTPYAQLESQDPVAISFEVQIPKDQKGTVRLEGFGLFNICESSNGKCTFRRKNVVIEIPVNK